MKTGRYYSISYEGRDLMDIWAFSAIHAKQKAIRSLQHRGSFGMNLPRLEVN